jgi:D-alanine-D-alanine ligase
MTSRPTPSRPTSVLILRGGPDREREVSLWSAKGVAEALRQAGLNVHEHTIDRISAADLADMPGDVLFPVLHGSYGEGGPLQDVLEASGRPYVGCRPDAARLAMDKMATKLAAARAGVPTAPAAVLNPRDDACPIPFQGRTGRGVVLKPIHDGSSVGVHLVRTPERWPAALAEVRRDIEATPGRTYMVESLVWPRPGAGADARTRELTVGVIDTPGGRRALPVIEIRPATDFYDYDAKYIRDDTAYTILPQQDRVVSVVQRAALKVAHAVGVRHLCRVDFLDPASTAGGGEPQMLEINTMPGFTGHSLLPMAAAKAGFPMPELCRMLVELAFNEPRA